MVKRENKIKIASLQVAITDQETRAERLTRVEALIDQCEGARLMVLPEIWHVGYFSFEDYEAGSETLSGATVSRIAAKAKQLNAYILAGSMVEKTKEGLYNTSVLLNPKGEIAASYRKIHLFGLNSAETELLKPGSQVVTVETELGVLGLSICYDLRFPELFRSMVEKGAEVFIICSAWPYPRVEHWVALNKVRAFENQCFLISSNCAGVNRGRPFMGRSSVVDPWGTVLAAAGDRECIVKAEIDLSQTAAARREFPALRDRVLKG